MLLHALHTPCEFLEFVLIIRTSANIPIFHISNIQWIPASTYWSHFFSAMQDFVSFPWRSSSNLVLPNGNHLYFYCWHFFHSRAQQLSKQRSWYMFQWQKVKTPPSGMLWTKIRRTTRGQNKTKKPTQTTKTLTLQKKHRRILRKFLRGNPSSALKSFKSQKPTSQANTSIIKIN